MRAVGEMNRGWSGFATRSLRRSGPGTARRSIPSRIPTSDGGWRFVPQSPATPPREPPTITRQETLPNGDVCAHPFHDDRNICRVCGRQR